MSWWGKNTDLAFLFFLLSWKGHPLTKSNNKPEDKEAWVIMSGGLRLLLLNTIYVLMTARFFKSPVLNFSLELQFSTRHLLTELLIIHQSSFLQQSSPSQLLPSPNKCRPKLLETSLSALFPSWPPSYPLVNLVDSPSWMYTSRIPLPLPAITILITNCPECYTRYAVSTPALLWFNLKTETKVILWTT